MTGHSFYSGAFTEYATFFLYLSDILLIIALFLWLISSKNLIKRLDFNKWKNTVNKNKIWKYLLFFTLVLGLNLIIKRDYLEISFFQFLKLLELILLSLYVYFNLNKAKWLFNSLLVLSISGFTQGIIAIFQFTGQQSFFKSELLRKITGESLIGADISGVAKFVFEGQKIVRSYGTFSHPNVLGGFLIFTILITILLYLESKSGYLSSKVSNSQLFSLYNNTKRNISQGIMYSLFWIIMIFVQISALFLTFSRVSWISFILAVIILLIVYIIYLYNVSRETIQKNYSFPDKGRLGISPFVKGGWGEPTGISPFIKGGWGDFEKLQNYSLKLKIRNIFSFLLNTFIPRRFKPSLAPSIRLSLKTGSYQGENQNSFSDKGIACSNREPNGLGGIILKKLCFPFYQRGLGGFYKKLQNYTLKSNKNVSRETNSDSCSSFDKKGSFIDRYNYKNFFSISSYQSKNYTYYLNSAKSAIIRFKELFIVIILFIFLLISNFSLIQTRIGDNLLSANSRLPDNSAISDRNFYNNVSRETISNNPLFGSGLGTFIFQIDGYLEKNNIKQKLEPWQYQPAHNIYFLIVSEIGVIGLLFFLLFLVYGISSSIKIVSRETIQKTFLFGKKSCKNFPLKTDKIDYSPLERGRLRSKRGVLEILQNYNLKLNIKSIFLFFLNTPIIRHFKPFLTPSIRLLLRAGSYQRENQNSSHDKGNYKNSPFERGRGVFENSQNCNSKSNNNVSRETILDINKLNYYLLAILTSFLFIGLFDHYFWTLQQGRLIFWLVLGFMLLSSNIILKENKD